MMDLQLPVQLVPSLLPLKLWVRIPLMARVRSMVFNFQQYFSYIVEVRFIGGGNRNARR